MTFLRPRDDRGMTLVEMLTAVILFALVGGALTSMVIVATQTTRNNTLRSDDIAQVQAAVEGMTKLVATAATPPVPAGQVASPAVISAGPRDLSFYGYDKPGQAPSLIRYYVDGQNRLIESVTPSSQCTFPYTWDSSRARTRVLARSLSPNQTVFTYFSRPVSSPTPYPRGVPLTPAGSPAVLTTTDAAAVEEVGISLSVDVPTSPDIPPTVASTTVVLPNHEIDAQLLPESAC